MRTDKELLDGLEEATARGCCPNVVFDDNGHWACTDDGMQNVLVGDTPGDLESVVWVEARLFRKTIREAIDLYLTEDTADSAEASPSK